MRISRCLLTVLALAAAAAAAAQSPYGLSWIVHQRGLLGAKPVTAFTVAPCHANDTPSSFGFGGIATLAAVAGIHAC